MAHYYRMQNSAWVAKCGAFATVLVLSLTTYPLFSQWTQLAPTGQERRFPQTTLLAGKLYLFGGVTASSYLQSAEVLNPATHRWDSIAALPEPRYGGFAATVNGRIYLIGGEKQGGLSPQFNYSVLQYDPLTNKYTAKSKMPVGTAYFAGAVAGSKIYMLGGYSLDGSQLAESAACFVYDVLADSWSRLNDLPSPLRYAAASVIGTTVYLVGGFNGASGTSGALKGLLGMSKINWLPIPNYPLSLYGASAGMVGSRMLVAGGCTEPGDNPTSLSHIYDPVSNSWSSSYSLPVSSMYAGCIIAGDGSNLFYAGGSGHEAAFEFSNGPAAPSAALASKSDFLLTIRSGALAPFNVAVRNDGVAPLTCKFSIPEENKSWLSASSSAAIVSPTTTTTIAFRAGGSSVRAGIYRSTVSLVTNDPRHPSFSISVRMFVRDSLSSQVRSVIVEENEGNWNGWVPEANDSLSSIYSRFGGNVIALRFHGPENYNDPMYSPASSDLLSALGRAPYPSAAVQRTKWDADTRFVDRSKWGSCVEAALQEGASSSVAINVKQYSFDAKRGAVSAVLDLVNSNALAVGDSISYNISAIVTEDSLHFPQSRFDAAPDGSIDQTTLNDYVHNDVVRTVWPGVLGASISIPAGAIVERALLPETHILVPVEFSTGKLADPNNCHITFVISAMAGQQPGEILQGYRQTLVPGLAGLTPGFTVRTVAPSLVVRAPDTAVFRSLVTNVSSSNLRLYLNRAENVLPGSQWSSWMFLNDRSYDPAQSTADAIDIAPSDSVWVNLYIAGPTDGTGRVTLSFSDGHDASRSQTYVLTAANASGVAESVQQGGSLRIINSYPIPAADRASVLYNSDLSGLVRAELYSTEGCRALAITRLDSEPGEHSMEFDLRPLPSGSYRLLLSQGAATATREIIVQR